MTQMPLNEAIDFIEPYCTTDFLKEAQSVVKSVYEEEKNPIAAPKPNNTKIFAPRRNNSRTAYIILYQKISTYPQVTSPHNTAYPSKLCNALKSK